jgi:hypothetical protein
MAQYRCIADIYTPDGHYASAGDILSDVVPSPNTIPIPVGWIPPAGAVDPIDADAVAAYTAAGVQGQQGTEPNRPIYPWGWNRWAGVAYSPPAYRWQQVGPDSFILTGPTT